MTTMKAAMPYKSAWMHRQRWLWPQLGCVLGWLACSALAQAAFDQAADVPLSTLLETATLEDLANIVVTDTKTAQSADAVTQRIERLRQTDIERQPVDHRNLSELLRYTSGQFVNVLSRNDANWGAYAGLGPKYNSYLLDGLPIDAFVEPMSLDPWILERIEAHKGPAAVMYGNYMSMDFAGNEAPLAGITNLVLKDRIERAATRLQAGYGSYDTFGARAYHQNRAGSLSYFVGASSERSDYRQYGLAGSWLQTVEAPDYRKDKLYGQLHYAFDRPDHTLSLFAHQSTHRGDVGRPERDFDNRYRTLNLAYANQLDEAWHVQFKVGDRDYDRAFGEDAYPLSLASAGRGMVRQRIRPLDLTLSWRHWGGSVLTAGFDAQTVDYRTTTRSADGVLSRGNDVSGRAYGVYLQEKLELQDWVLRAGLRRIRVEHDYALLGGQVPALREMAWQDNLWSVGARYRVWPSFSLYANAGSSFMAPAAKQIGGTIPSGSRLNGQLPNPSLRPESGSGRDLGFDWKPDPSLSLGLRVFRNRVDSAIVDSAVSRTPSQAISLNAGQATATGLEFDLRHALSGRLQWFANLSAARTRVRNAASPDQDGSEIPFAPDWVGNLGFAAQLGSGLEIAPYFQWVGRYYDSDVRSSRATLGQYGLLNARLQQTLAQTATHSTSLIVDLNNLLDRRYALPFGFQETGFNLWAALEFRF